MPLNPNDRSLRTHNNFPDGRQPHGDGRDLGDRALQFPWQWQRVPTPMGHLVADTTGDLYGTTGGGGTSANCNLGSGCGTIFELTQQSGAWSETVLYSFQGTSAGDGAGPQAGLVLKAGALYGTTASGGKYGQGTVFELAPPATQGGAWTETVLWPSGTDGSSPASGVIFDGTSLVERLLSAEHPILAPCLS